MMGTLGTLHFTKTRAHGTGAENGVKAAIQQASAKTGVDFDFLVKQADVESSMNPNAKARTSSATGLYQFTEQTWLRMVKSHGDEHGYDRFADAIRQKSNGDYVVTDRGLKSSILNMRRDPKASSLMAAELATENQAYLQENVGGKLSGTDLYLAHFLGAQGASNFLTSMKKNAWAPAASIFPEAARANRNVFYADGKPLSLQQVYNRFDKKFDGTDLPTTQVAQNNYTASPDKVVLPAAADWSDPVASRRASHPSGLMVFASDARKTPDRIGGFLSSPVDVMMLAQTESPIGYAHDDESRYNS